MADFVGIIIGAVLVPVGILICRFHREILASFQVGWRTMGKPGEKVADAVQSSSYFSLGVALIVIGAAFLVFGLLDFLQIL